MMGTSLQSGKGNGDDRFCFEAKARRNHYGNHRTSSISEKILVYDRSSNLDRFLESTAPFVPAQNQPKTGMRVWKTCDVENTPYFTLGDLWESFKEWSAYGAGVPLVLNEKDSVVQYYVPYLSGIELYGEASRQAEDSRQSGEDSDIDSYRDSNSDGSTDSELESSMKYVRDWSWKRLPIGSTFGTDKLSMGEDQAMQEGFSSDDSDAGSSQGYLTFQYLEHNPPYSREPLADKISILANQFPGLKSYRSCDLSPASWVSVAWYPIYRIPTGRTLKDLDACFLTFHSLSTPLSGAATFPKGVDGAPKISLPSFGLAAYKFKGSLWTPSGGCEKQRASSLLQAADKWLRLLSVDHPDYRFFTSRGA